MIVTYGFQEGTALAEIHVRGPSESKNAIDEGEILSLKGLFDLSSFCFENSHC